MSSLVKNREPQPPTPATSVPTTVTMTSSRSQAAVAAAPWHILGMEDVGGKFAEILTTARRLKAKATQGPLPKLLDGKAVVVIFEKNSTRTRVSFEIGIQKLGGIVSILDAQTSQLGRGESLEDTAGVLSRYADVLVYRAKSHEACAELARNSAVPVVNALTDLEHPCQILADYLTLAEHFDAVDGSGLPGKTLAYVGDGNNVCNSYLLGAPLAGLDIRVATPKGYEPPAHVVERAKALAAAYGTEVTLTHNPFDAVDGAHAVATDTWVSMGDEKEEGERIADFVGFTVDDTLMAAAHPEAVFIHCLPGHWGQEATHKVAHGPRSLILPEAENRMWAQMALILHILGKQDEL